MPRCRTLTILLCVSCLLFWEWAGAAPPAAKDAKSKKSATADDDKGAKTDAKPDPKTDAKTGAKTAAADKKAADDDDEKPEKVVKTDAEWRKSLSALQFKVTRKKFTEPAGSNPLAKNHKDGVYHCICCGEPLFDSKAKFESGTGWPSFFQPLKDRAITELEDTSENLVRTEVECSRCDAHLGHVFSDGPQPTGLRYCINGASLKFVDRKKEQAGKESKDAKPAKSKSAKSDDGDKTNGNKGKPDKAKEATD